jgi:hypothetical protein
MKQVQHIAQAQSELIRCNVELCHLHTSICDEEQLFVMALDKLKTSGEKIYYAVLNYCTQCRSINCQLLCRIAQPYALKGFTGTPSPGLRKGAATAPQASVQEEEDLVAETPESDNEDPSLSDNDELAGDIDRIVGYIASV